MLSYWEEHAASLSPVSSLSPEGVLPERLLVDDAGFRDVVSGYDDGVIAPSERIAPLQPDHLAYVIYTSGSTGTPKGTATAHKSIHNRLSWIKDLLQMSSDDAVLQKTGIGFDSAVWEWVVPLMSGSRLVIPESGGHKDPSYMAGVIRYQSVTVLNFVPSMLSLFADELLIESCPSISHIVTSGEALTSLLQQQVFKAVSYTHLTLPTKA